MPRGNKRHGRSRVLALAALLLTLPAACSFENAGIRVPESDAEITGTGGSGGVGGIGGTGVRDGAAERLIGSSDGSTDVGFDSSGDATAEPPDLAGPPPPPDVAPPPPDAPGLPVGMACASDGMCDSGFCTDEVCCEKRCGDVCHSCGGLTNGAVPGLCRPDVANTACGAAMCNVSTVTPAPRCDGMGTCAPRPPLVCPDNLTCASATACKARCTVNTDCTGGMVCDVPSGQCRVPGKALGQACAAGPECASGNCSDQVCCDAPCTGVCRSCRMAQTGVADGNCANLIPGTKDARCTIQAASSCGRDDGTCTAAGACHRYPDGTVCATECCRGDGGPGPGGAARVCSFRCSNGTCNRGNPTTVDTCPGVQCCCPNAGQPGVPACTILALCPGRCLQ